MFPFKFNCVDANDPFLQQIHETFKATPVLPPSSSDVDLLFLISHRGQETVPLGPLEDVLEPDATPLNPDTISSDIAGINLNKTGNFSLDLGFQLLPGIFKGFNLEMEPITGALKGGKELSFSFPNARRVRIFPVKLGSALIGRKMNTEHPLMKNVLRKKGLYVVTSLLQSREFSISLNKTRNTELDFDAAIQTLANTGLTVKTDRSTDFSIDHQGEEYLTFAFSCVELLVDKDGALSINKEVIWKRGENGEPESTPKEAEEMSFINPKLPAILSWD